MKIRYKNVKWSVPFYIQNEFLLRVLDKYIFKRLCGEENPIKTIYGFLRFPIPDNKNFLREQFSCKNLNYQYSTQLLFDDYNPNPALFYDNDFIKALSLLEENNSSVLISNEFMYNFLKNKFPKIKKHASFIKSMIELKKQNNTVSYYKSLSEKFDGIILDPKYVKEKFKNEYSSFSDLSKFEVVVNFDVETLLDKSEIDFLINEVGITSFRLLNVGETVNFYLEMLFNYVFDFDIKTFFEFTEYLNEEMFSLKNDGGFYE